MLLNEAERGCVKKLAEVFSRNDTFWESTGNWSAIGLTEQNYVQSLRVLADNEIIRFAQELSYEPYSAFTINAKVVQAAREIEREEK